MGYTLNEIRNNVRAYLDLDLGELPNSLIDLWCSEATRLVENQSNTWPMYSDSWTLNVVAGTANYSLAAITKAGPGGTTYTPASIDRIQGTDRIIEWIGDEDARRRYVGASNTGKPYQWSIRGGTLTLWPTPTANESVTIYGYRSPIDWVSLGSAQTPDMDPSLYNVVQEWAVGNAYIRAEDTELGVFHMNKAISELNRVASGLHSQAMPNRLVLNGGFLGSRNFLPARLRYDFE